MPKNKLPKAAYTKEDFKIADRFGRMYLKLVQPSDFDLNDQDEKYFKKLRYVYPLITEGLPREQVLTRIKMLDNGVWDSQAAALIKDAERLFAPFSTTNRILLKGTYRERMLKLAQKAAEIGEKSQDEEIQLKAIDTERKIWNDIAKNENLAKEENNEDTEQTIEVSYDDSELDITQFQIEEEYEYEYENTIHLQAITQTSSEVE